MYLKEVYLKNFRNYSEASAQFTNGLNLIFGENAAGKTNLLEAIYLLATGRSFRTNSLKDLIQKGAPYFFIEAKAMRDGVDQTIQMSFDGQSKSLKINNAPFNAFSPLLGLLPTVIYTPYDIDLISGSPTGRRRFINLYLAQMDPLYVHHLTCFWKAMKQRNCLLKARKEQGIDAWEEQMSRSAQYIVKMRKEALSKMGPLVKQKAEKLSCNHEVHVVNYQSSSDSDYLKQLRKLRAKEFDLGVTLAGPHRDDVQFFINDKMAKEFASEGQKRTLIAALKFTEWELLSEKIGSPAIMGMDDLNQSLDDNRMHLLKNALRSLSQVFVTSPQEPKEEGFHQHIEQGKISTFQKL